MLSIFKNKSYDKNYKNINVIALINTKSGSGKGVKSLTKFESLDNCYPINILDFDDNHLLDMLHKYPNSRVIIGGGDGTVSLGFEILSELLDIKVPIALLPIGTANEISGCTGWSNHHNAHGLRKYLKNVQKGNINYIDIWKITYNNENPLLSYIPKNRNNIMVSFLSLGFDADICHKFHIKRINKKYQPSIIESKLSYFNLGLKELFKSSNYINDYIELFIDNELINIPTNIRCLQVLNINSMANGINFFGTSNSNKNDILQEGDYTSPKLNDGLIEIVGTRSIHHMNQVRLKYKHSIRLGQGKQVTIHLKKKIALEVDGEAWVNPEGIIKIEHLSKWPIIQGPYKNISTKSGM